jgi:ribonuclease BN (tRNA processing enzyme)
LGAAEVEPFMEVFFLGVANAFTPGGLAWSGLVIDGKVVLDAPPTLVPKLLEHGIDPVGVEAVCLSHFHGDHTAGLPFLFLHSDYIVQRTAPLTVVGPPGVEDQVEALAGAMRVGLRGQRSTFERRFVEADNGSRIPIAGGTLEARRMQHSPDLVALGYRFNRDGTTIAYSGDTTLCDGLVQLGRGADLLVVECATAAEENATHMNLRMVRELRHALGEDPPILLTHREPGLTPLGIPNTSVAMEGERYRVRAAG